MGLINVGHWPGGNTPQDEADDEARARLDAKRAGRLKHAAEAIANNQNKRLKDAGTGEPSK